jgi:Type II secretion system protein C
MRTPFLTARARLLDSRRRLLPIAAALALAAIAALIGRVLVADIRAPSVDAALRDAPAPAAPSPQLNGTLHAANIAGAHLFGVPAVATQAVPVAAAPDLSLAGILYSTSPDDSRAIVVVGGQTIVGGRGSRLPNGDLITAVAADRILVDQGRNIVSVLLDIKKADPNAFFQKVAVDGAGLNGSLANYAPMSAPPDEMDQLPKPPSLSADDSTQHTIVHGQFLSLSAIRSDSANHFSQLHPPMPAPQTESHH